MTAGYQRKNPVLVLLTNEFVKLIFVSFLSSLDQVYTLQHHICFLICFSKKIIRLFDSISDVVFLPESPKTEKAPVSLIPSPEEDLKGFIPKTDTFFPLII